MVLTYRFDLDSQLTYGVRQCWEELDGPNFSILGQKRIWADLRKHTGLLETVLGGDRFSDKGLG